VHQAQSLELGQRQILDAIESAGPEELLMAGPDSVENPAKINKKKKTYQFSLLKGSH
jgi:hypothetical protein